MKDLLFSNIVLISLCSDFVWANPLSESIPHETEIVEDSEGASLRFHAQWNVDEGMRKKIHETYGMTRVTFDPRGFAVPHGLSPHDTKRWQRLYNLCMSDGCYYCDSPEGEGSCELGTCGLQNSFCRPHVGNNGQPICGMECADYAFTSILLCNDRSKTK